MGNVVSVRGLFLGMVKYLVLTAHVALQVSTLFQQLNERLHLRQFVKCGVCILQRTPPIWRFDLLAPDDVCCTQIYTNEQHRKVIMLYARGDETDGSGHGTHVSSTLSACTWFASALACFTSHHSLPACLLDYLANPSLCSCISLNQETHSNSSGFSGTECHYAILGGCVRTQPHLWAPALATGSTTWTPPQVLHLAHDWRLWTFQHPAPTL
jgi:hypothetical protein